MYDILTQLNFFIWVGFLIIYLVGNLTYADYYTKLESDTRTIINFILTVKVFVFLVNFILGGLFEHSILGGFKYGLIFFTGTSLLLYGLIVCAGFYYGFIDLKNYFGKKTR